MSAKKEKVSHGTRSVQSMLRDRYGGGDEWVYFEELADSTGGAGARADGFAMNLWASRGYAVHGFEVKVSRSDWLRELKNPRKAEVLGQFCDFWWLVVGSEDIVKDGELPLGWGLLVPRGDVLIARVKPERIKGSVPFDRPFIASLFRVVQKNMMRVANEEEIKLREKEAYEKGKKRTEEWVTGSVERVEREVQRLQKRIEDFQERSGVQIDSWDGGDIANAVRALTHRHFDSGIKHQLESRREKIRKELKGLDQALEFMEDEDGKEATQGEGGAEAGHGGSTGGDHRSVDRGDRPSHEDDQPGTAEA